MRLRRSILLIGAVGMVLMLSSVQVIAKAKILVFAAASMSSVLPELVKEFERNCNCDVVMSFAGSGTLARQIEAGAPVDVYISASSQWFDHLVGKGLILDSTRIDIATNRLVVAGANDNQELSETDIQNQLGADKFAMGDPVGVPAGIYAKQALIKMGVWAQVKSNAVYGENVRVGLAMVARGDVASAIVYESDLRLEPRIKAIYHFDEDLHHPIRYPAGLITNNNRKTGKSAKLFLRYLRSQNASVIIEKFGFGSCFGSLSCEGRIAQ